MSRFRILLASILFASASLAASAATGVASSSAAAPAETRQFDFLLGRWSIEVHPKVSGLVAMIHGAPKLVGSWEARRSADGMGVEDETHIFDASGNPISLIRNSRVWVAAQQRWRISQTDLTRHRNSESTATWVGGEMHLSGRYDDDGTPTLTRTRYCNITADSFRMIQDRSTDNGRTWDLAALTIDAHRTAAR